MRSGRDNIWTCHCKPEQVLSGCGRYWLFLLEGRLVATSEISPAELFLSSDWTCKIKPSAFAFSVQLHFLHRSFSKWLKTSYPLWVCLAQSKFPLFLPFISPPPHFWVEEQLSSSESTAPLPHLLSHPLYLGLLPMLTIKLQKTYVKHCEQLSRSSFI